MIEGKITRITGPIIYAEGLDGAGLYDLVDVGEKRLIGEIKIGRASCRERV